MERHYVVMGQLCELGGCPGAQGMGIVGRPVGAFEVEVTAQEAVQGFCGMQHFRGGGGGGVVPFVVFARDGEMGEGGVDVWLGRSVGCSSWRGGDVEGEFGGAFEWVAHEDDAFEEVFSC